VFTLLLLLLLLAMLLPVQRFFASQLKTRHIRHIINIFIHICVRFP
jgi:hypothetical protein